MKFCPICENDYPDEVTVCPLDGGAVRRPGARSDPFIGRVIRGRYRVERQGGAGGMGAVYLAEQISIGRKVALKVLRGDFARDDSFVARFRQEAKLVAVLNETHSPHITLVHDFDQAEDGSLFIVMEWLEGRGLNEVIKAEGALALPRAIRLAREIAEGLDAAHRAGVIHRDIKPHNIMVLDANDSIKLMDFGIARLHDSSNTPLTRVGTMLGTPDYMAPEQIEGQAVTEKTDIYSFGIVFYQMLTGIVPFRANTPAAVLTKQLREEPTPPTRLRPEVPQEIEDLVLRALAKNPDHRHPDIREIVRSLRQSSRDLADVSVRAPAPTAAMVESVDRPSPSSTIAVPTGAPATVSQPVPTPAVGPPAKDFLPAEPAPSTSPAATTQIQLSDEPTSHATVVLDVHDTGPPKRAQGSVSARSRWKLVVAGAVIAAALVGGVLATRVYLRPSPSAPPDANASANETAPGISSESGKGFSTLPASGTSAAPGSESPTGGNEMPRPAASRPAEPVVPHEGASPESGSGVKPLKNQATSELAPRPAKPAPPPVAETDRRRPPGITGSQAEQPGAAQSAQGGSARPKQPLVASKAVPVQPSADLLRT